MTTRIEYIGRKVKDVVTGFTGIAIADITYLNGCRQILVMPKVVEKKGTTMEHPTGTYVDVEQLKFVGRSVVKLDGPTPKKLKDPGGGHRQHP